MWQQSSAPESFAARRQQFASAVSGPVVFASGLARVRNFQANRFPFRAESHFLYFVGRSLEASLLCFEGGEATLYAPPAADEDRLWHGDQPTLQQLEEELQLRTRPIGEFRPKPETATLPPADGDSNLWLTDLLDRDLEDESGELAAEDEVLAESLISMRLQHDEAALAQIRQAISVTAKAHERARRCTAPGQLESVPRAELEAEFIAAGLQPAYNTICTTHGEVLHHSTSNGLMSAGDLLLVDAGCETTEGWASDVTRTWPVSGRRTTLQRELHEIVLQSQQIAIDALRPGVRFLDVHRLAGQSLVRGLVELGLLRGDPAELFQLGAAALFFPHGLGHLLGLDVHDMEDLGDRAGYAPGRERGIEPNECFLRLDRDLLPNMVVTIEPGFYVIPSALEGASFALKEAIDASVLQSVESEVRGIRIEDDVLITPDGCEVLSAQIPKD